MIFEAIIGVVLMKPVEVITTGYCSHPPCVDLKWADGITASGTKAQMGTCAADWSVFPKGTLLYIYRYGLCRVEDTGRLIKGNHIDLYFDDIRDARHWGRQHSHVRRVSIMDADMGDVTTHETQETVGQWAIANFGSPTPLAVLRRSCNELLEAMEICVVPNEATRTMFKAMRLGLAHLDKYTVPLTHAATKSVAEELADTMIVNYHAAAVLGIDLGERIDQKMDINRRRKWKQNADGTGQHVDEGIVVTGADQEEGNLP